MQETLIVSARQAAQHPMIRETPAVDFFEGAVLGNGALGAIVCTRPDAVMIHFGPNNVWDIRLNEDHKDQTGTFAEVFAKDAAGIGEDPWFREYYHRVTEAYGKPYPRSFPCGTPVLGFDRRRAELLGHRLDISRVSARWVSHRRTSR